MSGTQNFTPRGVKVYVGAVVFLRLQGKFLRQKGGRFRFFEVLGFAGLHKNILSKSP